MWGGMISHHARNGVMIIERQSGAIPAEYTLVGDSALYTRDRGWRDVPASRQIGLVPGAGGNLPPEGSEAGEFPRHTTSVIVEDAGTGCRRNKPNRRFGNMKIEPEPRKTLPEDRAASSKCEGGITTSTAGPIPVVIQITSESWRKRRGGSNRTNKNVDHCESFKSTAQSAGECG